MAPPSTNKKLYRRDGEYRTTISLSAEDREKFDQVSAAYKTKFGIVASHSIILSLGLDCLHKELCGKITTRE